MEHNGKVSPKKDIDAFQTNRYGRNKVKKFIIALLLFSIISTPCYAVSIVDMVLCKKVFLRAINTTVLVNRVTGEVKYELLRNEEWHLLTGPMKDQFQAIYNAQVSRK